VKHIYLAPHLDDAVLSCGGAIHRWLAAGETVLVITLFAGEPPGGEPLSPFAQGQPAHQSGAPRPAALRRAEDLAALARLGAGARHLAFPDAIYRRLPDGAWPYDDLGRLLGKVHPADPVTPEALAAEVLACLPGDEPLALYAPLAVGRHVDHQLAHRAARLLVEGGHDVAFYEDYPYAEAAGATPTALAAADAGDWPVEVISLSSVDLTAKVAALAYYHSQLAVLFGEAGAMPDRIWSFAVDRSSNTGLAERIWRQP
jgi:LmbE family N-acetylglucosaminyl deacetylase